MTTFNSYAEAKIANPDRDIFTNEHNDKFQSKSDESFFIRCLPSHHCMTVDQFIAEGHRFANGDICLDDGDVVTVKCRAEWDEPSPGDNERYVLRAAALDVMAQDNEATEAKAVAEYSNEKPKRVKVEFVKVEDSIFDLREEFEKYELYSKADIIFDGCVEDGFVLIHSEIDLAKATQVDQIYRKVETEIDERQEFIEIACNEVNATLDSDAAEDFGRLFDSGKFKLGE